MVAAGRINRSNTTALFPKAQQSNGSLRVRIPQHPLVGAAVPDCSFRFQGEAMDQIQAMRIFVRVVEAGTFTRAADSLSL
ncbi:MAG: LysR family transcriptional regulator, partial [Comamonadaceae bacterium]